MYVAKQNVFKERSGSLKPKKLEMKEFSKPNMPVDASQPFFSFKDSVPKDLEHKLKSNQTYSFPSKPPKSDLCKLKLLKKITKFC
jgi:hypothetical protein